MSLPTRADLDAAVRAVLTAPDATAMTARDVRTQCEQRLGLPKDGLHEMKEVLLESINAVLAAAGEAPAAPPAADKGAVAEVVAALEDDAGGAKRAEMLIGQLSARESSAMTTEAMLLLCDACAASAAASRRMIDGGMLDALVPFVTPAPNSNAAASLAVRMLSAMSTHAAGPERCPARIEPAAVRPAAAAHGPSAPSAPTAPSSAHPPGRRRLLKSRVVAPLLARLASASDELGVSIAALLHNLADSPGSRLRLLHHGALLRLCHIIMAPEASAGLKEHCLQAAASLAGRPEAEISFPQVLGLLCAARAVGTQRDAVSALQLVLERQPGIEARLAQVAEVTDGLEAAAAATDAGVAAAAAELLASLRKA